MSAIVAELRTLVEEGSLPPFVCAYPPRSAYVVEERPTSIPAVWKTDLRHSSSDLNIYIHIPFCSYRCGFCNLYTVICADDEFHRNYVDAVCQQLRQSEEIIRTRRLRTVYIGGGTPTLLPVEDLERIFSALSSIYPNWQCEAEEVAIEASPDTLDGNRGIAYAAQLARMGVNRVNIGVQSLQTRELKEAGRARAGIDKALCAIDAVRRAAITNLSTDPIIGFAAQTEETWDASVSALLNLRPDTISTYFLTIRPDAWFERTGRYSYTREPELYGRYDRAREALLSCGYVQQTNVRYKLPGCGGYLQKELQFKGVPVLGIGAGARSYTNTVDYLVGGGQKPEVGQVRAYIDDVAHKRLQATSGFVFNNEERIRKRLALDLFDLDLRELDHFERQRYAFVYEGIFEAAVRMGLLTETAPDQFQLTSAGYRHRDILSWMFFSEEVKRRDSRFYARIRASGH